MRSFLDVLTNWYIRRSRDRFWDSDNTMATSTQEAFDTLYTALEVVTRTVAPLLPLTTEEIWRGLTGGRSVHLTDWPDAAATAGRPRSRRSMDRVRDVCSAALVVRKAARSAGSTAARVPHGGHRRPGGAPATGEHRRR
jgi:isoleucyl-tRNA synthetase